MEAQSRGFADAVAAFLERSRRRMTRLEMADTSRDELLSNLEEALEELRVTEEELSSTNDELRAVAYALEGERERYRELFDAAPDGYVVTDDSGVIRDVNHAASQMLGLAPAFSIGKPLLVFVPEEMRSGLRAQVSALARLERMKEWDSSIVRRDGTATQVSVTAAGTVNPLTGKIEIRWMLRDATSRQLAHEATRALQWEHTARLASEASERRALFLAETSRRLAAVVGVEDLLRLIPGVAVPFLGTYCVVDQLQVDGSITRVAGHAEAGLQDHLERMMSRPPAAQDAHGVARALRTGRSEVITLAHRADRSDAGVVPSLEVVVPMVGARRMLGAITIGIGDIAGADVNPLIIAEQFAQRAAAALDHALLYEQAETARRDAERANETKASFLAALSHELRTPLTAALGYTELLLDGVPHALPEPLVPFVCGIKTSIRHQLGMMEDLLLFTSANEGKLQLRPEMLDLRDVLNEVSQAVRADADSAGIRLELEVPDEAVVTFIDRAKARRILLSLATNAVRFTERGEIVMQLSANEHHAIVQMRDTGTGIAEEDLQHIFHQFWRTDTVRGRRGFGLGLTITQKLVDLLGGAISVSSTVGSGTTFRVELPIRSLAETLAVSSAGA
jgi:PAS domain S-box-containing protein